MHHNKFKSSMSALGQKRTWDRRSLMSALPPKADTALFDHLVRERDQRGRYGEAEGLGSLEVNYEIKFCRLHDRQVGWLLSLENSGGIDTSLAICIRYAPRCDVVNGPVPT